MFFVFELDVALVLALAVGEDDLDAAGEDELEELLPPLSAAIAG